MDGQSGPRFEKWSWLGMRLSGLFFIFILAAHVFIQYIPVGAKPLPVAEDLQMRWVNPGWKMLDGLLLVLSTVHTAGGIRQVALGRTYNKRNRQRLFALLGLSWLAVMALGILALSAGGRLLFW